MMRKIFAIGGFLSILITFQLSAQGLENDDMYFNSKDREKLKAAEAEGVTAVTIQKKQKNDESQVETEVNVNPPDSYSSARTINPEFIARSNSAQASADEQNYYVEGYGNTTNTYDSYSATNSNNTSSTSYPGNSTWANSNTMYNCYSQSPWSYSPYNGYYNPYMNPYSAGSGWALSLGYYSGCSYGSGMNYGMNYGYGNSYYNPYSYYSPYSSYGYGGYPVYYGTSNENINHYSKRPSRHSAMVTPTQRVSQSISTTTSTTTATSTGGRVRQSSSDEYYVKPSRRTSSWSPASTGSNQQSTSDYSRTRSSGSSYTSPSRSNNSYSSPSPSRSSYSSSPSRSGGSSVSPSRSRGR